MSKRNLTLLIITLVAILAIFFGYIFFSGKTTPTTGTTTGTNFFSFLPFTKTTPTPPAPVPPANVSGTETTPPAPIEATVSKLIKVSSMPIAGFTVFQKERFKEIPPVIPVETTPAPTTTKSKATVRPTAPQTEFVPSVRYVAKNDGNIYQTFAEKIEERKFTTTVVPQVYEAYFGAKGESVFMRYLKSDNETIETFIGSLPKEILGGDTTGNTEIKGSFLPENITDMSMSPDATQLFYLFNTGDTAVGITSDTAGVKKSQVFDSSFTEWLSWWPNNKMITLTTKPSANIPGYMYTVDPTKKDFNRILGDINGLTTLTSPNGKLILYGNNNLSLNIYNTEKKESTALNLKTLPEKCVWSKNSDALYCSVPKSIDRAAYPDSWYQGEISFSDEIWKINITNNNATDLADLTGISGEEIDGVKLALDDNENYLFFVNKKDSYLWELNLH
ncbi:MAG: hypothetical protein V4439_02125 [Patescibacteria group bacterium]